MGYARIEFSPCPNSTSLLALSALVPSTVLCHHKTPWWPTVSGESSTGNGALYVCSRGELIPSFPTGLQACQLALSTRTVWARCPNGDLARRYGVTDKNPAGDYWKKIPGSVSCFTVTSSDELWAVGPSGCLLQRLTKTFSHSHNTQNSQAATSHPEELEDEWEVI